MPAAHTVLYGTRRAAQSVSPTQHASAVMQGAPPLPHLHGTCWTQHTKTATHALPRPCSTQGCRVRLNSASTTCSQMAAPITEAV